MNPSSHRMNPFIQSKLFLIFIVGFILLVPMMVTAQESTEEPQDDPVVTEQPVEQPTEVEETIAPTEAPPVEETVAPTEETASTPVPEATDEEAETEPTDVSEEPTEEVVVESESTEEADPIVETTEEATDATPEETVATEETPVVETPADITEISEDFEAWTGDGWTVVDWSVEPVDDSLALTSAVANATSAIDSLDWANYTITVDVKVEAGNTLTITFADYKLVVATDGRNRLSQGDTIIATSPTVEVTGDEPTWHTVNINKAGATLTVTVDDIPQYTVETTDSPLGIFAFMPGADTGVVIDNLVMAEVDEADVVEIIATPTPESEVIEPVAETTQEPDLLAEETEEPDLLAEATEEPMAETTQEPDLLAEETEEPDLLAEATEEPEVDTAIKPEIVVTNLITDDFEGDLLAWNTTASIVEVAEGNHALLLPNSGQLAPAMTIESTHVVLSGEANILNDGETAGMFTVAFGTYTIDMSTTGVTISNNGEVVAVAELAIGASTWFDFTIEASTSGITVAINDAMIAEYAGELVIDGNFIVTTNTSTMLDNLSVDTVGELADPLATPAPETLTEETRSKLRGIAEDLMNVYLEGGEEGVAEFLATIADKTDELGRIRVNVLAESDATGETIAQIVTDAGGEVARIHSRSAEAYVDVQVLVALANNENIRVIRNINRATSTGPVGNNGLGGEDFAETWTEGYNLLSAHEWHLAGVTGQDVKVGVVDVGFNDADSATQRNGNLSCLASTTPSYEPPGDPGLGTSTHGTEMIEVICDMAPDADIYMFRADSVASLRDAVSAARNPTNRMDVLVIALDLGVNTSAGGGIAGNVDENVYGELEAAKNSGMVIIAAAGNNNRRTLVLRFNTGDPSETEIDILNASDGDVIKFGWNDFEDGGSPKATISANVSPGGSDTTDDPHDGMEFEITGNGTASLSIDPTVSATTYLQVQIVPADPASSVQFDYDSITVGSLTTDMTHDDNIGNLARPADSDAVISVGAICTRVNDNPSRWEFSSKGPRFNASGSPIAFINPDHVTQEEAKPTLMSYSFVSTSDLSAAPEGDPPDSEGLLSCTDGFGGTSAAAAHVAGMTALVMSNDDNASFSDMNEANATSADTFEAIRNYLQARSVDLPLGAEANGFDNDFGSGLAILGAPSYDLDNTTNLTTQANQLPENCDSSNTLYVGQASLDNTGLNGDILSPFTSIAAALNGLAPGDIVPECIIVMPGEYVSPIFVENSYDDPLLVTGYSDVSRLDVGDVIYWMRSFYASPDGEFEYSSYPVVTKPKYRRRAGLYYGADSANVEFSGFTFVPARFYTDSDGINNTQPLSAVVMDGASDTTISNSQFGKLTLNGVDYPGWDNINATPIQILNNASGSRVENNIFNENSVDSLNFYPTVAVVDAGTQDNPIVVKGNEIFGNNATIKDTAEWSAILYAEGSHIDIINNAIYENAGGTIIKIATTNPQHDLSGQSIDPTHTRRARIVGNVFLNNQTINVQVSESLTKSAGALINARFAPMMYIINNTFIGNVVPSTNPFGEFFSRGNANADTSDGPTSTAGSLPDGWAFWEIHNNLIYNNTYYQLVGDTASTPSSRFCSRIPNDDDSPGDNLNAFEWGFGDSFQVGDDVSGTFHERGAQNNWIVNNTVGSGSEFGDCQTEIATMQSTNHNITDADSQPVHERSSDDRFIDDGAFTPFNQIDEDPSNDAQNGDFQGQDTNIVQPYDENDWQYYALGDTFIDPDQPSLNEFSDGIDAGGDDWLLPDGGSGDANDLYMDNADIEFDIIGTKRPLDVSDWEINWIAQPALTPPQGISGTSDTDFLTDIGAFEFSPLQFETQESLDYYDADQQLIISPTNIVDPVTDDLKEDLEDWDNNSADPEDDHLVTFDLSTVVTGGFGDLTFIILEYPNNYGAQCGDQFEDKRGLVHRVDEGFDEIFDYCPPPNFYTDDTDTFDNNDYVSFQIRVEDEAGAFALGEVRFTIDRDEGGTGDDSDFAETSGVKIGDELLDGGANESDLFEVVTTLGADVSIRLRPYVRFGNFFFSENSNPEFVTNDGRKLVDYPFTYSNVSIDSDPQGIIETLDTSGLPNEPVISLEMSDSQTGTAVIHYDVTDQKGGVSTNNVLTIRSVSIVPTEGLHDDTSFIWNYSDSDNAPFYTEADGFDTSDVPQSGDWQAVRDLQAINQTLHTTSTVDDVATFRLIGTGFTIFMRGGSIEDGQPFALKVFDDLDSDAEDVEVDLLSLAMVGDPDPEDANDGLWVADGNLSKLRLNLNNTDNANLSEDVDGGAGDDLFECTTRAGIDPVDAGQLVHDQDSYTITCDGLSARTHSVQIINTGGGTLSVDAFSIINGDLIFDDAGPIPPGFHDVDNSLLQNAFFETLGQWSEVGDTGDTTYSNGVAMQASTGPIDLSFQITDASGFSIGTSYLNNSSSFNICVNRVDPLEDGICTVVHDNVGSTASQIHIPFYGLDPDYTYEVTLTSIDSGFIFDDLVVFGELLAPVDILPLGETDFNSLDLVFGEPFGDDWEVSDDMQVINDNRSPIGPFVAFQMGDEVDTFGIKAHAPSPQVECPRKGPCPEPEPKGFSRLLVCVNRGVEADDSVNDYSNCVILDSENDTSDVISSVDGTVQSGDAVTTEDAVIYVTEGMFADDDWGDNGTNTVEIFNLYPETNINFTSIILFSTESGLGTGKYAYNSPGFLFVEYDRATDTYSDTDIGDGVFDVVDITECVRERRGICEEEVVLGTKLETTGIGNAVIFKMLGTGLKPNFLASANSRARICFQENTGPISGMSLASDIAAEIQDNGDCQTIDISQEVPFIQGIENSIQHVMIELLPGTISTVDVCVQERRGECTEYQEELTVPAMNFEGVEVISNDWQSLTALTPGERYESNFSDRANDNKFAYVGQWSTLPDTDGTHSGTSYDRTSGDLGATVLFKVSNANTFTIIRDLQTPQIICDSKAIQRGLCEAPNNDLSNVIECSSRDIKAGTCPTPDPGFSEIIVCVAPLSNPNDRLCSVHNSDGNETQVALPISLNDDFTTGDFIVSIAPNDNRGFVLDAVEVFDTTSDKMTVGTYQETSELIAYTMGQRELLKDTSFEIDNGFLDNGSGENWDWSISTGVSGSKTTEDSFIGSRAAKIDADNGQALISQEVDLVSGLRYTAIARVNVISGTLSMDMENITGFEAQSNQFTDTWELLRFSFEATGSEADQLKFIAGTNNSTFFVDDVHIYEEASWTFGGGEFADGKLATTVGHGAKATFMFTGTGFTVKLDSDDTSGETRVCYDDDLGFGSPTCFTYDNEQSHGETICTGSRKNIVCTDIPSTNNNGHTIVGLPSGDYMVTIEQMDNGLRSLIGEPICVRERKGSCEEYGDGEPPNSPINHTASVKLDYVRIYDNTITLPVIGVGTYNENAVINGQLGLQLFPADEWAPQVANSTESFTNNSYYQADADEVGSQFALKVDNSAPATVVIDINQVNPDATKVLACTDTIEGAMNFNGTSYDVDAPTNCLVTDRAAKQTQLVFNQHNLSDLDGLGGETTLIFQSMNDSQFIIDGYQVLYGTTLTEGHYEESIGYGIADSILTITNVSGTDDWESISNSDYSGNSALKTSISGTTVSFTFEGTGVSMLFGHGESITTCLSTRNGVCTNSETNINPVGKVSIALETDGGGVCGGSCNGLLNTADSLTQMQVEPGPFTIAGLPYDTYTVTITAHVDETLNEDVVLDAIDIFGTLQQLGSLYDDAQTDVDSNLLLTYGPGGSVWNPSLPNANGEFLNNTLHYSTMANATVSFEVGADHATEAIILYDGNPTLPDPVCVPSGRREICQPIPFEIPSTSAVEVCWSDLDSATLDRTCDTYTDFDDGISPRKMDAPSAGHYSVSITNKASGEPLYIDAIQVLEAGLMTEGIYEDDEIDASYTPVANTTALNDFVIELNNGEQAEFTFEGIAYAVQLVESSTNFHVCTYAGNSTGNGPCGTASDVVDEIITPASGTLSSVAYGGFHDLGPVDNGRWTVIITNNDATNPLLIDRVDILGNNNSLMISETGIYEAGEPQIRYLPFGSWTETSEFKDGAPLNNSRFDTTTPGSAAYFEFDVADVGLEYVRQIRDFMPETQVCVSERNGSCRSYETVPPSQAFADARICLGEVGDPESKTCVPDEVGDNGDDDDDVDNKHLSIFEFGSNTDAPLSLNCATNGCWVFIEYSRDAVESLTPLDYIRLYDPDASLTEGIYQEYDPNINDISDHEAVTVEPVADENARSGYYDRISGTSGESYFYFPFQGTGFAARMLATANAEEVHLCLIDYTGGALPTIPDDIPDDDDCVNTFDNEQTEDGFVTRAVHGLDPSADYMAIIKMNSPDGSTVMGLDQVTIFDLPWYDPSNLSNADDLNLLIGGNTYPIDFKSRETDKLIQFIGNWQSIYNQILVGYENPRKQQDPIFVIDEGDRGFDSGASALFRTDQANAVTIDVEVSDTASFQICALPLVEVVDWEVDVSSSASCKTFTQSGRANASFVFSETTTPHVITLQLLDNDIWMSIYNVSALDVTSGFGAGKYDDTAPGIKYDLAYEVILEAFMEEPTEGAEADEADDGLGWDKIGSSTQIDRAGRTEVCVEGRRGIECEYVPEETLEVCVEGRRGIECEYVAEPTLEVCVDGRRGPICENEYQLAYEGSFTRKVVANIGQGIKYVGDGNGISLEDDTYYTVTARVFVNQDSIGGVNMRLVSGTEVISEIETLDLSTTTRGAWQTLRANFKTTSAHDELSLQLIAINGQTIFFVDDVSITTGGTWSSAVAPMLPDVCTGKGKRRVCTPGGPVFDAYNTTYTQSTTPGASFSFDFNGTGFELGLIGGNETGEVEVCYSNEVGFANPTCFTYIQDDGEPPIAETCVRERNGECTETAQTANSTLSIAGRGVAGLPDDEWTVVVHSIDDGYNLSTPEKTRFVSIAECIKMRRDACTEYSLSSVFADAVFGLDFINVFGNDPIPSVPFGLYNEDADESDVKYLGVYPENDWSSFSGNSTFTKNTYVAPSDGATSSTVPGPVALLNINVPDDDADIAVVFQFGDTATGYTDAVLICVDETTGKMGWDGTQYTLSDSDSCIIANDPGFIGQANITSDDVEALGDQGDHVVTISALSSGNFWIDGYQIFDSRALKVGLHNETLPSTILDYNPGVLNASQDCDPTQDWCYTRTKTTIQDVCIKSKGDRCVRTAPQPVTVTPYIGSAAITSQSGSTLNFVAEGTGFSIITDVGDNGLDFRLCYKLASSDTSFPAHTTPTIGDELIALNGIDGDGLPVLISEGGVLCENLTTDAENWDTVMKNRTFSSGEQYGFSYYGLPFNSYEVQVLVTTPQVEIGEFDWFTVDAINVFSNPIELAPLTSGLTDDSSDSFSYEPSSFWDTNVTSNTYMYSDSTTAHAGAISQFRVDGNTMVLYQTVGDMTPDAQVCLVISNENIHCTVEAERQTRLARQVTNFTQVGTEVLGEICVRERKGVCSRYATALVQENSAFTPVVFYGLGVDTVHKVIVENRVQGKIMNIDAVQVID